MRSLLRCAPVDTKAKVAVGPYCRHGRCRSRTPVKAADHDLRPEAKLVPLGILEVDSGQLFLSLGLSAETSDFIADGIEHLRAWEANQQAGLRRLGESPATFPDTAALERRDCAAGGRSGALGIERDV